MNNIKRFLLTTTLVVLSSCTINPNQNESSINNEANSSLKIGGSFETLTILERLSTVYQQQTAEVEIQLFPPSQTSSALQGVKDNLLDIGAVSRVIEPEEVGELQYIPLAQTPLVFVVHDSVTGVENLTTQEIKAIYRGTISNWQAIGGPDAPITLFDFTEDENEKIVLRQHYLGSELDITSTAIVFAEDDELIMTTAITPYSLAAVPFDQELEELPLKVLTVNDVVPSLDNLAHGIYQGTIDLGVVIRPQSSQRVEDFLDFALSAEGQTLMQSEESE